MSVISRGDRNFEAISQRTLNLNLEADSIRLLQFLNSWGCRQFIIEQHPQAAERLSAWYFNHEFSLPSHDQLLIDIPEAEIRGYSILFDELMNLRASTNRNGVNKRFGPVGAAKALFALRKNAFPPWDNPISDEHEFTKNGVGYTDYLLHVKEEIFRLEDECEKHGIILNDLPQILDRPNVTTVKLVDEYLWLTITRGFDPQEIIRLARQQSNVLA